MREIRKDVLFLFVIAIYYDERIYCQFTNNKFAWTNTDVWKFFSATVRFYDDLNIILFLLKNKIC